MVTVQFVMPNHPEYSFEVQAPSQRPWEHPEPEVVDLDLAKLDEHLSKAEFGYVGPGGTDAKSFKHKRAAGLIDTGVPIEMPIMSAALSDNEDNFLRSVRVRDGRHRLWNLKAKGYARVTVVVPAFQANWFKQLFG